MFCRGGQRSLILPDRPPPSGRRPSVDQPVRVILPLTWLISLARPSRGVPPLVSPIGKTREARKDPRFALRLRVFGRFGHFGQNGQKHSDPLRRLPKGVVLKRCFLAR